MYIFELSIFNLHIAPTWYWLSYAMGFIVCYFFVKKYLLFKEASHIDSLLSFLFFGIIIGWRIWYVILYNLSYFIENPLKIISIWEWWMSFHGWFIGTILAVYLFSKKYSYKFWKIIDTIAIIIPVAIWFWRIGNWINKELPWYTPYDGYFPMTIQGIKHFPSPLFEMILEWVCLSIVMLLFFKFLRKNEPWIFSWIFLIWYSIARIISEQFRLPDSHIWYLLWTNWVTLGIIYTIPMLIGGLLLVYIKMKRGA